MSDLWTEASVDVEAEAAALALTRAKVACAPLWPFLAQARSERDFSHRLALADDTIAERVVPELYDGVVASLREDFRALTAANSEDGDGDDESGDGESDKPDWLQERIGSGAGPVMQPAGVTVTAYFDQSLNRWVKVALDDDANSGKGNPWYFTGGPEAGPETGETNQFPTFPQGSPGDPWSPLNQQYPATPSAWTVPPGGEWKESPMQFSPPGGPNQQRSANHHRAAQVGDEGRCDECSGPMRYVKGAGQTFWSHTGRYGAQADDDHMPTPSVKVEKRGPRSDSPHHRYTSPVTAAGNPEYFAGGTEGIAGDQQSGFPEDVTLLDDEGERMSELYGAVPPQQSHGTTGRRRVASEERPAPDSDPNLGTEFASSEEADRYRRAQAGETPGNRDSTALTGRKHAFFDPTDPGVRMVAADGFGGAPPVGETPEPPPAMTPGGPGTLAGDPMPPGPTSTPGAMPTTTKPRQLPGGGGTAVASRHLGEQSRNRPTVGNPFGTDDPFDATTWDNANKARPMVGLDHMRPNTPQNPMAREPIRTVTSEPGRQVGDDDDDD